MTQTTKFLFEAPQMTEQRILVVSVGSGLNRADRDALKEAGIVVVTVKNPHDVKLLSSEPFPATSNDMLVAAIMGLNSCGVTAKSTAWDALTKALQANAKAETP